MPFKSKQQMKFLYKFHPKIAKRWTKEQEKSQGKGSFKKLPKKLKRKDDNEPLTNLVNITLMDEYYN